MVERTNIRAYFIYSLALTGVVRLVVTKRVWDYIGWIAVEDPFKGKLYRFLARSNVVCADDGNSGLTCVFALLPKIGHNDEDTRARSQIYLRLRFFYQIGKNVYYQHKF